VAVLLIAAVAVGSAVAVGVGVIVASTLELLRIYEPKAMRYRAKRKDTDLKAIFDFSQLDQNFTNNSLLFTRLALQLKRSVETMQFIR
jgi:hypothetical protein